MPATTKRTINNSFFIRFPIYIATFTLSAIITSAFITLYFHVVDLRALGAQHLEITKTQAEELEIVRQKISSLESEDQRVVNEKLKKDLAATHDVYLKTQVLYEKLNDAKMQLKTLAFDKDYALTLKYLSELNYASAEAKLAKLSKDIDAAVAASQALKGIDMESLAADKNPPGSGYRRQKVTVDGRDYVVDIATGDLSNTKVIVDTASNETCGNDCPVLSLGEYAARSGAWAAINGSYFCPASYPSCAGKTNSFDLLVMNKNKVYFNSDNNVYSTNPAVIFMGGSVRFVSKAQEWGRDTGIDSMLSNYPLLILGGTVQFGGNDDSKMSGSGSRPFVANKGNTVYIGIVRGVSVLGAAKVLGAMGMENAINLDSGGSTAMWVNGSYKAGPGRAIPNAILFVKK